MTNGRTWRRFLRLKWRRILLWATGPIVAIALWSFWVARASSEPAIESGHCIMIVRTQNTPDFKRLKLPTDTYRYWLVDWFEDSGEACILGLDDNPNNEYLLSNFGTTVPKAQVLSLQPVTPSELLRDFPSTSGSFHTQFSFERSHIDIRLAGIEQTTSLQVIGKLTYDFYADLHRETVFACDSINGQAHPLFSYKLYQDSNAAYPVTWCTAHWTRGSDILIFRPTENDSTEYLRNEFTPGFAHLHYDKTVGRYVNVGRSWSDTPIILWLGFLSIIEPLTSGQNWIWDFITILPFLLVWWLTQRILRFRKKRARTQ